jgi:HSP20 family protein
MQTMTIARWNPFEEMTTLSNVMDRLFSDLYEGGPNDAEPQGGRARSMFRLPIDVRETEKGYQIRTPVPGVKPEDVDISFADGVLTITATRRDEQQKEEGNLIRRELMVGTFRRQIALPNDVRPESIDAHIEEGMLTVEVERARRPQPHRVQVRAGQSKSRQIPSGGNSEEQKHPVAAAGSSRTQSKS